VDTAKADYIYIETGGNDILGSHDGGRTKRAVAGMSSECQPDIVLWNGTTLSALLFILIIELISGKVSPSCVFGMTILHRIWIR